MVQLLNDGVELGTSLTSFGALGDNRSGLLEVCLFGHRQNLFRNHTRLTPKLLSPHGRQSACTAPLNCGQILSCF